MSPSTNLSSPPTLMLGTAMWGWTIPKNQCFEILDAFYESGFRGVDGATNYPINKRPEDFRLAEKILQEWIQVHQVPDLEIMMKVGSINNMRTPEHNLSYSFLSICLDDYLSRFDSNLGVFMIHWDNRENYDGVKETLELLQLAADIGLGVGLSGIRHPGIYAKLNQEYQLDFDIQIKHNLLHSDYQRYTAFQGKQRFITYGINAGGLKLEENRYQENSSLKARGGQIKQEPLILGPLRNLIEKENAGNTHPPIKRFNECGMVYAYHSPDVKGILLGASSKKQLMESIAFYQTLETGVFLNFYDQLKQLSEQYAG